MIQSLQLNWTGDRGEPESQERQHERIRKGDGRQGVIRGGPFEKIAARLRVQRLVQQQVLRWMRPIEQEFEGGGRTVVRHPDRQGRPREANATGGEDPGKWMGAIGDESHLRRGAERMKGLRPWRPHIVVLDECLAEKRTTHQLAHQLHVGAVHRRQLFVGPSGDEAPQCLLLVARRCGPERGRGHGGERGLVLLLHARSIRVWLGQTHLNSGDLCTHGISSLTATAESRCVAAR